VPFPFNTQGQDQEGLVEMAIVELGRTAQHSGDDGVSGFQFFEHGEFRFHKRSALRVEAIAGGGD